MEKKFFSFYNLLFMSVHELTFLCVLSCLQLTYGLGVFDYVE